MAKERVCACFCLWRCSSHSQPAVVSADQRRTSVGGPIPQKQALANSMKKAERYPEPWRKWYAEKFGLSRSVRRRRRQRRRYEAERRKTLIGQPVQALQAVIANGDQHADEKPQQRNAGGAKRVEPRDFAAGDFSQAFEVATWQFFSLSGKAENSKNSTAISGSVQATFALSTRTFRKPPVVVKCSPSHESSLYNRL